MGNLSMSQLYFLVFFNIFPWILTTGFLLYLYFSINILIPKELKDQIIRVKLRHTSSLDAFFRAKIWWHWIQGLNMFGHEFV